MQPEKIRLLIVEDNLKECRAFRECIATMEDQIELIGVTGSSEHALRIVKDMLPNAIILDLELSEGDGVELFYELQNLSLPVRPYIIVTTNITADVTLRGLHENGVGFIFSKHLKNYSPRLVLNKFLLSKKYILSRSAADVNIVSSPMELTNQPTTLRKMISDELGVLGITTKVDANKYLTEAILLAREKGDERWNVSKWLYETIAKIYNTNNTNVEHSIRVAIEAAWKVTDPDVLREHYGQAISPAKGCPTNKEFISYYAHRF